MHWNVHLRFIREWKGFCVMNEYTVLSSLSADGFSEVKSLTSSSEYLTVLYYLATRRESTEIPERKSSVNRTKDYDGRIRSDLTDYYARTTQVQLSESVREELIDKLSRDMRHLIVNYTFDEDSESMISDSIDLLFKKYPITVMADAFQRLVVNNLDYPNILCFTAKYLCSLDFEPICERGISILTSLLAHTDIRVKEYAVILIDNWKCHQILPMLRNIDCSAKWLRDYIEIVIGEIGG